MRKLTVILLVLLFASCQVEEGSNQLMDRIQSKHEVLNEREVSQMSIDLAEEGSALNLRKIPFLPKPDLPDLPPLFCEVECGIFARGSTFEDLEIAYSFGEASGGFYTAGFDIKYYDGEKFVGQSVGWPYNISCFDGSELFSDAGIGDLACHVYKVKFWLKPGYQAMNRYWSMQPSQYASDYFHNNLSNSCAATGTFVVQAPEPKDRYGNTIPCGAEF